MGGVLLASQNHNREAVMVVVSTTNVSSVTGVIIDSYLFYFLLHVHVCSDAHHITANASTGVSLEHFNTNVT